MKHKRTVGLVILAGLILAGSAFSAMKVGPGITPFWIFFPEPQQIDLQVARLLADHAAVIAIRLPDVEGGQPSPVPAVLRLKKAAPQTPVLMYAWASRFVAGKPGSAMMSWMDRGGGMYVHRPNGRALRGLGDVTLPEYRAKVAASIADAVNRGGYDGVALDLAIRTPKYRPRGINDMCSEDAAFCAKYAQGVDATFDAIRGALGSRSILYNGLWNLGPGAVADQEQLLNHSDAAIVEYFGGGDLPQQYSFSHDILPYVEAMATSSEDKKIMVFGRSPLAYTTYAEDYAWERYLYCSYLLGARANTYFKYHSTFSASPRRRTGGLSIYADWSAAIGAPTKAHHFQSGLYTRTFSKGMVIVAPDDGRGGSYDIAGAMYSPEGGKYQGHVSLSPGEGLLLLDSKPPAATDEGLLELGLLADWPHAVRSNVGPAAVVSLQAGGPVGSHDMLLDAVRLSRPRTTLDMLARAGGQASQIQVVAEIDDPARRNEYAILALGLQGAKTEVGATQSIVFRSSDSSGSAMPVVDGPPLTSGAWQTLSLDGPALFAHSGLVFRRWDYVRFIGAIDLKSVKLHN